MYYHGIAMATARVASELFKYRVWQYYYYIIRIYSVILNAMIIIPKSFSIRNITINTVIIVRFTTQNILCLQIYSIAILFTISVLSCT